MVKTISSGFNRSQIKSKLISIRARIKKLPKMDADRFRLEVDRDMFKLELKRIRFNRRQK